LAASSQISASSTRNRQSQWRKPSLTRDALPMM
jgi:hypothetical protein